LPHPDRPGDGEAAGRAEERDPTARFSPLIDVLAVAALNAHDLDRVAALCAEVAVVERAVRGGGIFRDRAEITAWLAANLRGVPDLLVAGAMTGAEMSTHEGTPSM